MKIKRALTITMLLASVQFLNAMKRPGPDTTFFLTYRGKKVKTITLDALSLSTILKGFVSSKSYYSAKDAFGKPYYNEGDDIMAIPLDKIIESTIKNIVKKTTRKTALGKIVAKDIVTFIELLEIASDSKEQLPEELAKLKLPASLTQLNLASVVKHPMILDEGLINLVKIILKELTPSGLSFVRRKDGGIITMIINNLPENILNDKKVLEKLKSLQRYPAGYRRVLPLENIASIGGWEGTPTGVRLRFLRKRYPPFTHLLPLPDGTIISLLGGVVQKWSPDKLEPLVTLFRNLSFIDLALLPNGEIVSKPLPDPTYRRRGPRAGVRQLGMRIKKIKNIIAKTDVFDGLTFEQFILISELYWYKQPEREIFVLKKQSKAEEIFKTLPDNMQRSLISSLGWATTPARLEKAKRAAEEEKRKREAQLKEAKDIVSEIYRKLKQINNNFNKIYVTILKAGEYNKAIVGRIKSGGTYLQTRLDKLPDRVLELFIPPETPETIIDWKESVKNIITLSNEWHELFWGNDPDFKKKRDVTIAGAKKWAETWYDEKREEISAYEKVTKTFETSTTFGKSSKILQSIFKLMHGMLDGVHYTVGAPLGFKTLPIIGAAWPQFKERK